MHDDIYIVLDITQYVTTENLNSCDSHRIKMLYIYFTLWWLIRKLKKKILDKVASMPRFRFMNSPRILTFLLFFIFLCLDVALVSLFFPFGACT